MKMKRMFVTVFAACMMLAMSTTAFAAESTSWKNYDYNKYVSNWSGNTGSSGSGNTSGWNWCGSSGWGNGSSSGWTWGNGFGWSWGGNYPDEWAISKNWWKSQWIIKNLLYLKGFGYFD